jgi:type I restriction enzyme, S subunit
VKCPPGTYVTSDLAIAGVLAIGDGYRAKNSELSCTGLPFARAGNIDNGFHFADADCFAEEDLPKVGEKVSRPGDVVFTSKGTVGRFAFVRDDTPTFVFSPQLCYWRSLDPGTIVPRWLYYWMNGSEFWQQASGVKGQTDMADYVSLTDQRRMSLTLPDVGAQRSIASVLGALDDKIEHNRRTSEALERLARATFKAWFVDFEPVRAKAHGAKSFPGMPAEAFAVLPVTFNTSRIGPIPFGWEVCNLDDLVDINPTRKLDRTVPAPYVEMSELPTSGPSIGVVTRRPPGSGARFVNGDTLFARITPCLENGKTALVDVLENEQVGWGSTEFIVLRPKPPLPHVFAYLLSRSEGFRAHAIQSMAGTSGRQRVQTAAIAAYPIAKSDPQLYIAFGASIDPLFALISAFRKESQKLAEVRDYLLPKLLSGHIEGSSGVAG